MVIFILAQIFGILGPGATIIATQMKDKKKYLLASIYFTYCKLLTIRCLFRCT